MILFRTMDIILVAIMISCAAITYKVKYDAQRRISDVRKIVIEVEVEKNAIHMRKAEWAKMTQPQRMLELVERYEQQLELQIIEARQIVPLFEIPERLPDHIQDFIEENDFKDVDEFLMGEYRLDSNLDSIKTGSVD